MSWKELKSDQDLDFAIALTNQTPIMLFKHSTRCSISTTALSRLERNWNDGIDIQPFFLDLIQYRSLSNLIENKFFIKHESPQVLVLYKGECIYHASHLEINYKSITKATSSFTQ